MSKTHRPGLEYERKAGYPKFTVAGSDEVGRGCIAGPVVAAAVVLPSKIDFEKDPWLRDVNDSKGVAPSIREQLVPKIQSWAMSTSVGWASVEEIDQINIFHASHLAMIRAVQALSVAPKHLLVDGKFLPKQGFSMPATAVIQGDSQCLSIAAASILAKVWRDRLMGELDQQFPGYGFAKHKGYPTVAHTLALQKMGITPVHRRSFRTVSALALSP